MVKVTLRPCRQASTLFTSTLAAHLKTSSYSSRSEAARTEKSSVKQVTTIQSSIQLLHFEDGGK